MSQCIKISHGKLTKVKVASKISLILVKKVHPSQKVSVSLQTKRKCIYIKSNASLSCWGFLLLLLSHAVAVTKPNQTILLSPSYSFLVVFSTPRGNSFDKTGNKFSQLLSNLTKPYGILFSKTYLPFSFFGCSVFILQLYSYFIAEAATPKLDRQIDSQILVLLSDFLPSILLILVQSISKAKSEFFFLDSIEKHFLSTLSTFLLHSV